MRVETDRFKCFSRKDIAERDDNLDIFWLKDDSLDDPDDLPEPEDLVAEAVTKLETALDALNDLALALTPGPVSDRPNAEKRVRTGEGGEG